VTYDCVRRILRKTITRGRSHQRVSAEIAWSFSLLPFQFSTSHIILISRIRLIVTGLVISLFSTGISSGHYPPEVSRQFLAIRIIIWMNCALGTPKFKYQCFQYPYLSGFSVMSYVMALLTLSVITQLAFDVDVWKRDIDASPSPFPMSIIIPYALPSTARFFSSHSPIPSMTTNITGHSYCLPGCACTRKLLPPQSAPDTSIIPQLTPRTSFAESAGGSTLSSVPVRLPTERERRRSIIVAFEGLNRTLSE
jgi:hypothetical protein